MKKENEFYNRVIDVTIDAPEILRLYQQAWWADTRTLNSTIEVVKGSSLAMGIFNKGDQLLAFGRVVSDGLEKATIYDIIVDKSTQSKGLGTAIVELLINDPFCQKINHIELYCKEEMIPFYAKMNFVDITNQVKLLRLQK